MQLQYHTNNILLFCNRYPFHFTFSSSHVTAPLRYDIPDCLEYSTISCNYTLNSIELLYTTAYLRKLNEANKRPIYPLYLIIVNSITNLLTITEITRDILTLQKKIINNKLWVHIRKKCD